MWVERHLWPEKPPVAFLLVRTVDHRGAIDCLGRVGTPFKAPHGELLPLRSAEAILPVVHFWGLQWLKYVFFEHFFDIVRLHSPVAGLFKFGSVRFFGDSREISPYVLGIFPKFSV